MGCILSELYMGELLFDTHDDTEHIAMIEKQCGPLPLHMSKSCRVDQINKNLYASGSPVEEQLVRKCGRRFDWPNALRSPQSFQRVQEMLTVEQFVLD